VITDRTYQFALAAVTYELLTGRPAFAADSVPSILFQVVHQQPDPITKLSPNVGRTVEAVVFKALSKAQEERYPSVLDFHAALTRAATDDQQISPMDTPAPVWLPQTSFRHRSLDKSSGARALPLVAPTAELPPVSPATRNPKVAPTERLEPAKKDVPTTLGSAVASFESKTAPKVARRAHWCWP